MVSDTLSSFNDRFDTNFVFQVPESSRLRIIIVGAGLSGIGAAISCALAGHSIVVLESAKELAEV